MTQGAIRFDDGAAYERFMGVWSRLAGAPFLDWLAAPPGLAWLDVGCGNGAFTELLVRRCAPAAGVAEMARVVRPGGTVAAYAWDMPGGGFPYDAIQATLRGRGLDVPGPPRPEASRAEALQDLWAAAGLEAVETRRIAVRRTFAGFDDYWATALGGPAFGPALGGLGATERAEFQAQLRERLPATDAGGQLTVSGSANAVRGHVPRRGRAAVSCDRS